MAAMSVGGVADVVQEACLEIVKRRPQIECRWTTAACNHARWALLRMLKKERDIRTHESLYANLKHEVMPSTPYDEVVRDERLNSLSKCWVELSNAVGSVAISDAIRFKMHGIHLSAMGGCSDIHRNMAKMRERLAMQYLASTEVLNAFANYKYLIDS